MSVTEKIAPADVRLEVYAVTCFHKRDSVYYAYVPQWELLLDGDTPEEAIGIVSEAISAMAGLMIEDGSLDAYLADNGYVTSDVWDPASGRTIREYNLLGRVFSGEVRSARHPWLRPEDAFILKLVPALPVIRSKAA